MRKPGHYWYRETINIAWRRITVRRFDGLLYDVEAVSFGGVTKDIWRRNGTGYYVDVSERAENKL